MKNRYQKFTSPVVLSAFFVITGLVGGVNAQHSQTTDADGNVTTTGPSDAYGPGGTHVSSSDKNFRLIVESYRDKCGRVREWDWHHSDQTVTTTYNDENGKSRVAVHGGEYWHDNKKLDPKEGKALVEKLKKTPSAPCPEKQDVAPAPPEKPKDHPNPLEKILQGVSIGVGVSGGQTVGRDDHKGDHHVTDRKHTSSTTKKLPAGCKCHPCTCSPCHCRG
jgi:hypothetical protein